MPDLDEKHLNSLRAFVLRARRVRAHSLAQDSALLAQLRNPRINVRLVNGKAIVTRELPPEEQIESAAARIRPLILQDETTFHAKVMNALLYFGAKGNLAEIEMQALREHKKDWAKVNPKGVRLGYYEVRVKKGEDEESRISDNLLAFSWIYGDVVHADPARREEGKAFGVEERFRAAIPVVVRLIDLTTKTLEMIELMAGHRLLPDLVDAFEEDVVVSTEPRELEATVYVSEYYSDDARPEPPAMGEEFGEGWKTFEEAYEGLVSGFAAETKIEPNEPNAATVD